MTGAVTTSADTRGIHLVCCSVGPGDMVFWHPDLVHAVDPEHHGDTENGPHRAQAHATLR